MSVGFYKNGKMTENWTSYHENGQIETHEIQVY